MSFTIIGGRVNIHEGDFRTSSRLSSEHLRNTTRLATLFSASTYKSPEVDRLLIELLVESRRLLDFIAPLKSTGEIHGLPKESTSAYDRPEPIIYLADDPARDFGPWSMEKTSRIQGNLFKIAAGLLSVQS